MYEDLRKSHPLPDPVPLLAAYAPSQKAAEDAEILKFQADAGETDPRVKEWLFWLALASVGVFVREAWAGTKYVDKKIMGVNVVKINAEPGPGAPGQYVVKGKHGTVIWMTRSKRLSVTRGGDDFMKRLRKRFLEWDIATDGAGFTKGNVPQQIANTMRDSCE